MGARWLKLGFVGPTLVFLIALNVFPLAYNGVLGFTDAELVGGGFDRMGGANYGLILNGNHGILNQGLTRKAFRHPPSS